MTKNQKRLFYFALVFALMSAITPVANAMHIMEGFLPAKYCIEWGVICIPFLVVGFLSIEKSISNSRKTIIILAMTGAFIFVISSLKIPSVTGSCSHMTGTGLGAILYGPTAVSILGIIVLIFQATLLAHGGFTSLGANTFSMAIAGPLVSYGIYKLGLKLKINKHFTVFLAAAIGDLFTYCITSFQLGLAYPSQDGGVLQSVIKFLGVFAITQVPLAILEGILTVLIIIGLETYAKPELEDLGYMSQEV